MSTIPFPRSRQLEGRYQDLSAYPSTEQGWADCYDRRWACYVGEPYDLSEIKAFHLFRALDENNDKIDETRRIFTIVKFVVDTDVGGVLGGRVALEVEDGIAEGEAARAALLVAGEAVWKRSRVVERLEGWVRSTAVLADFYLEALRTSATKPYRTTLVGYDARNVTPIYDQETGTRLLKVIVEAPYIDEDTLLADGTIEQGALHTYRREVDEVGITVSIDGKPRPDLSGPHGAGTIPVVHLQWAPFTCPEHGLPAAAGVDQAVMMMDSFSTQSKAIGTRFANPILRISGGKLPDGSDIQKFGRAFSGAADMTAGYVEPSGNMLQQLRELIREHLDYLQDTLPEFVFADAGINVSAEAKLLKAQAFENKVGDARNRIFAGLARVTAIAVAMDADAQVDPERIPFRIDAPPVLPRNVPAEIDTLIKVRDAITPGDFVRHLQRLGVLVEPEAYAKETGAVDAVLTRVKATAEQPGGAAAPARQALNLTPTDIASIVTVDEARASQGLPPLGGEDGKLTVTQYQAKNAATVAAAAQAASGEQPAGEAPAGEAPAEDEDEASEGAPS